MARATTDGARALLSLAGERPELVTDDAMRRAVADPRLLAANADVRLAAAVDVERAWIERHVLVPLMLADRWFSVDPDLRGMMVRPDGVPIFNDAYFGGAR